MGSGRQRGHGSSSAIEALEQHGEVPQCLSFIGRHAAQLLGEKCVLHRAVVLEDTRALGA